MAATAKVIVYLEQEDKDLAERAAAQLRQKLSAWARTAIVQAAQAQLAPPVVLFGEEAE